MTCSHKNYSSWNREKRNSESRACCRSLTDKFVFAVAGLNVDEADNYTGHVTVFLSLPLDAFSKVMTPVYWEPAAHGQ